MKKLSAIAAAMLLTCSVAGVNAFAADDSVKVNMTIVDGEGKFAVTQEDIEVTDADSDGKLTINDAFILVHDAKFEGGHEAGFATEEAEYGPKIVKFWGVENGGGYGYYLNNQMSMGLSDAVADGDTLNAFVYQDATGYSDTYSFFDKTSGEAEKDGEIELTLKHIVFTADGTAEEAVEGAVITINGEDTEFKTDAEGKVTVKLTNAGSNLISAKSETLKLVPPVCSVNVAGETETTTTTTTEETTTTTTTTTTATTTTTTTTTAKTTTTTKKSDSNSPKTGDAGMGLAFVAIGSAAFVAFAARKKNED